MRAMVKRPLWAAAVAVLSACGGGGGDAAPASIPAPTAPAKFTTADNGAAVASAVASSMSGFSSSGGTAGAAATAAPKASLPGARFRILSASSPRSTTTSPCNGGGQVAFTDDPGTVYSSDGTEDFQSCVYSGSSSSGTSAFTLDGKVVDQCTDAAQTTSVCNVDHAVIGESSRPYSISVKETGATSQDSAVQAVLTVDDTINGATDSTVVSGTGNLANHVTSHTFDFLFEQFTDVLTTGTSTSTETIDGTFGVTSNFGQCSIGKVTVKTNSAIVIDSNGDEIGGNLTLTDGSNQQITIQINSDGSVTVTYNGQVKTYTKAEAAAFCE